MGKPVFLHLNGDSFKRKRIVVNQREMRSFDSFLSAASERFRSPAREIRTPAGRHRIRKLDDLQRDCTYVVMGREPFKNVGYVSCLFAIAPSIFCSRTQQLSALFNRKCKLYLAQEFVWLFFFRYDVKDLRPHRLAPLKEPEVRNITDYIYVVINLKSIKL